MAAKSSFIELDDDIFIAASPKTGSTWLKALLASVIHHGGDSGSGNDGNNEVEDANHPLRYHHPQRSLAVFRTKDLKRDLKSEVKKLISFLSRPLVYHGEADEIVRQCNIERLKSLKLNKNCVDP
ncbi:hypothetical protein LOK49_LG09G02282 [Camellia lanceoleosa]|uniref:Uncharacterized protein n=1 Tax=Camellia lanceoleosa TaxID=1840588 RepID=A0ACC0GPC1_9ERIC|nr:hypothetical protein LOK49_LG09G02282 [Camellia lanceoleosa]